MTAEIAILNKTAVALATDSAVTISAGQRAVKIFESADKLFEMSDCQPIAIMIYNGMQFLGVPLETVIKEFRKLSLRFKSVELASEAFLNHLYDYVDQSPEDEIFKSISGVVSPVATEISNKIEKDVIAVLRDPKTLESADGVEKIIGNTADFVIENYETRVLRLGNAEFLQRKDKKAQKAKYKKLIVRAVEESISGFATNYQDRIVGICTNLMKSNHISGNKTGLVFAGFGDDEQFPTLISYEIDGLHDAKIRAFRTEHCDIDRNGVRAMVRPFAQKEMVDRFLHGLDDRLRRDITKFCEETVGKISEGIVGSIRFEDESEKDELFKLAKRAEKAFTRNLNTKAFSSIQQTSRREIEDMVEFMPKPELAKMAEALIDLTSIKRKVSQGLETVGGPVDVALISKSEGFVWVKRKHYFPADRNTRYFARRNELNSKYAEGEQDE